MRIDTFSDKYTFLSNFSSSPIKLLGEIWPTVEHAYQGAKTLNKLQRQTIRLCSTPGKAKRLGRKVDIRKDWEEIKFETMLEYVRLKFLQNPEFGYLLQHTHNAILIEGNCWHDNIWGNCTCKKCEHIEGKNWLGEILMQVREELK